MTILSFSEMPVAFTGHALFFAARTKWLSFRRDDPHGGVGSTALSMLKGYALTAYAVCTAVLCAPLGVVYHGASALGQKTISWLGAPNFRARANALAWEHSKAMLTDISGIALVLFGGFYTLCQITNANAAMSWWFSSTRVRTEYAGPPLTRMAERDEINNASKGQPVLHWGKQEVSADECPYQKMRVYAVRKWEQNGQSLPLNHAQIVFNICVNAFEGYSTNILKSDAIPAQPAFLSENYACVRGADRPEYRLPHWKTCLKVIVLIISGILSVALVASVTPGISILQYEMPKIAAKWILPLLTFSICPVIAGVLVYLQLAHTAYLNVAKEVNVVLSSAEIALYRKLLERPLAAGNEANRKTEALMNGENALYWLKSAASRGNPEAQRILGLSLLAAASRRARTAEEIAEENAVRDQRGAQLAAEGIAGDELDTRVSTAVQQHQISKVDHETLWIIREGASWLQAAAINRDQSARQILDSLFSITADRYFRGIAGATAADRTRSLLEGFGHRPDSFNTAITAFQAALPSAEARDKLPRAIAEGRKRLQAIPISKATKILLPVCQLIADYLVALDQQSPFFTPSPAA